MSHLHELTGFSAAIFQNVYLISIFVFINKTDSE